MYLLTDIDKDVKSAFKNNEYIKNRFAADYKRVLKDGSIIPYILTCSSIIRALPKDVVIRSRLYSEVLRLTETLHKSTGNPRFGVLEKNLREMMKKKVTLDNSRIYIEIKAGTLVKDQGNTTEFTVKNSNPVKINIIINDISSENAKISVSGSREFPLPPGSKGDVKLLIEPSISGKIILKSNIKITHGDLENILENYFELPVIEEAIQPAAAPMTQTEPVQRVVATTAQSAGASVDMDIEGLLKRAKTEEWVETIEDCVENEQKIELNKYSKGALAMYGERGYKNLLVSALLISQAQFRKKDVIQIFRGDAFSYRNIELLMDLSKKKELEFEAGSSDVGYLQEGLNIITGDFELPSKEKKRKKRWEILLPSNKMAVISKEIIKDETGRAKSIIFRLSQQ